MNYEILPVDSLWKFMALQLAKRHFQCQLKNHWTPGIEATVFCQSPQKTLGEKTHADSNGFGSKHIKLHKKCWFANYKKSMSNLGYVFSK